MVNRPHMSIRLHPVSYFNYLFFANQNCHFNIDRFDGFDFLKFLFIENVRENV
jgi:hypothetical protein